MSITHILLPTDLSESSQSAFAPAAELAQKLGARITLLCAMPDRAHLARTAEAADLPPVDAAAEAAAARERLKGLAARFPKGVQVHVDAVVGPDVGSAIVAYAQEHVVDLIAMATHGRSGISRLLQGSVAESVLRHTHVPMLLYPEPE